MQVRPAVIAHLGPRTHRSRSVIGAAVLAAVLLGCSGPDAGAPSVAAGPGPTVELSTDVARPPDVSALLAEDRGAPPAGLVVEDVVPGDGPEVGPGDRLRVHHVALRWSDGVVFDSTWERGSPLIVVLGSGRVIAGWEEGLVGMRVGGRRLLVVPPSLAYGDRGAGTTVGPDETLVFVVDLIARGPAS